LENFNRFKLEKLGDLEAVNKQVRDARKDLATKDLVIDDLTREKEEFRLKVRD